TLGIKNVILAENGQHYDAVGSHFGQEAKFAGDNHRTHTTAAELFLSLNPASLDFTPSGTAPAGANPASGGADLPTGRAASFFGGTMANTAYVGATNPAGPKWWQGWTVYAIN
ncbi:MAG TPA: hypothetical protein VD793_08310, partial [Gemmatimonadales bacterium]|nr:hypothetical protein [Gemmatimonadales bacterium]